MQRSVRYTDKHIPADNCLDPQALNLADDYYIQPRGQTASTIPQTNTHVLALALAGMLASTLTHPLDVIRTRVVADDCKLPWRGRLRRVVTPKIKNEGRRWLTAGLAPTLVMSGLSSGLAFSMYHQLVHFVPDDDGDGTPNPEGMIFSAMLSNRLGQFLTYPLDTVRRNMMGKGKSRWTTLQTVQHLTTQDQSSHHVVVSYVVLLL